VLSNLLFLGLGLLCAAIGGELFVRGLIGIASWLRFPAALVGATVAAFATSSPELTVAINAAADDRPEIALGDALGSNIVNVGLVIGLLLLVGSAASDLSRRDALTALGLTVLLGVLIVDGELARTDGMVLLLTFAAWLSVNVDEALRERGERPPDEGQSADDIALETLGERRHRRSVVEAVLGLVFLVAAGRLLVVGAKGLGADLGLSTFVVGVVLVSLGTSLPELATAVASKVRGHAELGLGTALGSNVFNISFIVGVTTVLSPFDVDRRDVWTSLVFGAAVLVVLLWRVKGKDFGRWRGALLLAMYGGALGALLLLQA
jgi:cation:H+ antiporter